MRAAVDLRTASGRFRLRQGYGGQVWIVIVSLAAVLVARAGAQAVTLRVEAGSLHVRAPGFTFIKGVPLTRLKDGASVRFDFTLQVLARPDGRIITDTAGRCVVSYDLWEERFAVSDGGVPSRSHLTAADAEAWCLDRLAVPLGEMEGAERGDPFWLRLEYSVRDEERAAESGLSLRGLVDRFSRRGPGEIRDRFDAGPLRLTK